MDTYIVPNTPKENIRCVVFNRKNNKPRPVYEVKDGFSYQACNKGDLVVVSDKALLEEYECFFFKEDTLPKTKVTSEFVGKLDKYLNWSTKSNILPIHDEWNGRDTVLGMLKDYRLDLLLHSVVIEKCIPQIIELKYPYNKVQYIPFDANDIYVWKRAITTKGKACKAKKIRRLFEPCGQAVVRSIETNTGILGCSPNKTAIGVEDSSCDWRCAGNMPKLIQLGMFINKWGVPTRFNEVFLFSKGKVVNSISPLPLAVGFKHSPNKFISIPVEIDKSIDRVIYIVYGHDLNVPDKEAIKWWLFKR